MLIDLLPLILFSIIIAVSLIFFKKLCIKIFKVVAIVIKGIITLGLILGIINFLTEKTIINNIDSLENAVTICLNASVIMTGAFPLLKIFSYILSKPLKKLSRIIGINEYSITGLISTLATSITTFEIIDNMDDKGVVLNSAFIVSASFLLADHLAFTIAFNSNYILPMIIGKMISGITGVLVAHFIFKINKNKQNVIFKNNEN